MKSASSDHPLSDFRVLFRCACVAALIELLGLGAAGYDLHCLAHPQKNKGLDPNAFLEAQMVQLPAEAKLISEAPTKSIARPEVAISKKPNAGKKATEADKKKLQSAQQNVTQSASDGPALGPTHGPVAVYTPQPVIPPYLTAHDWNKTVVIEFFITAQGAVMPRLIVSSEDEELDALAIATAKKWQFRPAEQDHKPIDSKVRLRIVFEVH